VCVTKGGSVTRSFRTQLMVVQGDIAVLAVDAVANAANDRLWMGAGVAGALKRRGGVEIEREAVAQGPIAVGQAVATTGGRLTARWVIHAAVMGQDLRTNAAAISSATESALALADKLGVSSLALPAFGTGVGGFPVAECACLMMAAVTSYLGERPETGLRRVVFATYDQAATAAFEAQLARAVSDQVPRQEGEQESSLALGAGEVRGGQHLLYLSRADIEGLGVEMAEVVAAVDEAFRLKGLGTVLIPPKVTMHGVSGAFAQVMPAWLAPERPAAEECGLGVKLVMAFPQNAARHLPVISALIVLHDPQTGVPVAVLEGASITAHRTGASVAVAARYLAPPGAACVGVLGCGAQARASLRALTATLPTLRAVRCFDSRAEAATAFAEEAETLNLRCAVCSSAEEVCHGAQIVVTAITMIPGVPPPLGAGLLMPGALAVALDYDAAWTEQAMAECDRFVVDDAAQVAATKADGAWLGGVPSVINADLGEVVAGRVAGRTSSRQRIFCLNLGIAVEDVVCAQLVYRRALAAGAGTLLPR